jgi:peptidoglycan/LPS O-acetylase OafA/YrhL
MRVSAARVQSVPMPATALAGEAKASSTTTIERRHVPQLDGLRFLAILGVLVTHEWQLGPYPWIFGGIAWGSVGVRLFFVLSGFLITGILLDCRRRVEQAGARRSVLIRRFYVRRFLRIYPLYYGVLAGLILLGVSAPARQLWPWLMSYTTNIYIWQHQQWIGPLGIFWTLAVEEQFYLLWPFLVFFVPRRWLVPVLIGMISLAPIFRLWAGIHEPGDLTWAGYTSGTFTLAVLDSLGMGALLAILSHRDPSGERLQRWLNHVALPVGGAAVLALLVLSYYLGPTIHYALGETALALVLAWLVGSASRGFRGPVGRFLEWRPVTYLGKVSYGIYVLHPFVPLGFVWVAHRLGTEYTGSPRFVNFLLVSVATAGLAALSWQLFEGPINGLKRYFPYRDVRSASPGPTASTAQT